MSTVFFFNFYKLYKKIWRYASVGELNQIFKAVTYSIIALIILQYMMGQYIDLRILINLWMLQLLFIGGSRFIWRIFQDIHLSKKSDSLRTLIIGAGSAGTMIVHQLQRNRKSHLKVIAFVDDDLKKQKLEIYNVPVIGTTKNIQMIVNKLEIENIVIAIPSLDRKKLCEIFERCTKTNIKTQIVPKLEDILDGKIPMTEFRDVQVEDVLGREPIQLDNANVGKEIIGTTVLITGAGGSIGSEICRQIITYMPKKIVLLGHGENSIYTIEMELKSLCKETSIEIITEIADIQDRNKTLEIMEKYKPYIVYHAAAHKHVPLMERNPEAAVKNNIFGTKNVAEAADIFKVHTFVMISTDKAVNPTNVMGATKRFAEMIVQHMEKTSTTRFVVVRFGNVLGSRGSVIPLFKQQIQKGGPVTITHPNMSRYFMTIPEASRLVIQAGTLAKGGELFVLDMGEPVQIIDLARNLITLSGHSIEEIGIEFTGIRPGEKMYEELLNEDEIYPEQIFPKIHIGKAVLMDQDILKQFMSEFEEMDQEEIRVKLLNIANNKVNQKKQIKKRMF